jgi:hypothetical protein
MGRKIDLLGQRFGRLSVVADAGYRIGHSCAWVCQCDCGNKAVVRSQFLVAGLTQSCGCLHKETFTTLKHGFAKRDRKTRLYQIWEQMKQRCNSPNNNAFDRYGNKGIKVCDQWNDYMSFHNDMIDSYLTHVAEHGEKDTTIDRKDNDKGYSPDNCRWATYKVQGNNRKVNLSIEYKGEVHNLTEWSEIIGMRMGTLWNRLYARNWPIEKAFTTPVQSREVKC